MRKRISILTTSTLLIAIQLAYAGSATWNLNPLNNNWTEPLNWTPNTVPNGPDDVATFGVSNTTLINAGSTPYAENVSEIIFNPGANAYVLMAYGLNYFEVNGAGITNNSGITQNFVGGDRFGTMFIAGSATAGHGTVFTAQGPDEGYGGRVELQDTATASDAKFIANCGLIEFLDESTADHATLIADAAVAPNSGGVIEFHDRSQGAFARVELFGDGTLNYQNGSLNLKWHYPNPSVSIGSLEGNGQVNLWAYGFPGNNLIVGSNNLSTTFSGVIDGNFAIGSLTKVGHGTFTLSNANGYGKGTVIKGGTLLVRNTTGSATGPGAVQVQHGRLGGSGIIAGAVTLGSEAALGAILTPGNSASLATLTIQGLLTFNADASYSFALNSSRRASDEVIAQGVTINNATVSLVDNGAAALPQGTSFAVISNTSTTPISGAFSNLADGATVTIGSNTFQANYEGGDGNDLTLTVVP